MLLRLFYAGLLVLICVAGYRLYDQYSLFSAARTVPEQMALGAKDAELVVVEFFDYECGFCKKMYEPLMSAVERDGHVKLVVRSVTAPPPKSSLSSLLAAAAARQGKFAEMHKALFGQETALNEEQIRTLAKRFGLDYDQLMADTKSREVEDLINENARLASGFKVYNVPTFVIGDMVYIPYGKMPTADDFLKLFAEARGKRPS